MFEDGHLTDGLGNRVNFKNAIIIMTSNIGARFIQKKASMGFQASDSGAISRSVNDMVLGEVRKTFNPEFINRIDEIIVFEALSDDDLRTITNLLVKQLNDNLVDRKIRLVLASEVIDWIIEQTCKDRSYGARPLRRAIQRYIEDPLSEELIRGHLKGGEIEVYLDGGTLAYRPLERPWQAGGWPDRFRRRGFGAAAARPLSGLERLKSSKLDWLSTRPGGDRGRVLRIDGSRSTYACAPAFLCGSDGRPRRPGSDPAPRPAPPAPPQTGQTVCGQPVPAPRNLPPAGSGPVVYQVVPCFEKQGGFPVVEANTYLYYIEMKSRLSNSQTGKWVPYDEAIEQVIREDFKRLWATNFLDDLAIRVEDYTFSNGVIGKMVVYDMEERQRVKIVDYEGLKKVDQSKIEEALKEKSITIRLDSFIDPGSFDASPASSASSMQRRGISSPKSGPRSRTSRAGPSSSTSRSMSPKGPRSRSTKSTLSAIRRSATGSSVAR